MSQAADSGRPVAPGLLIRDDETARVYLTANAEMNVVYELGQNTVLPQECHALLANIRISAAVPMAYLAAPNRRLWRQMLGEATALAVGGDLDAARKVFETANKFLTDRAGEAARMWYVQAILMLVILLLTLYGISDVILTQLSEQPVFHIHIDEEITYTLKYLLLAVIGGTVGAGFSLLVRVGKLRIDPAAGKWAHYGEVLYRLTIGAGAGFVIIVGWQAELFATFLKSPPVAPSIPFLGDVAMRASGVMFLEDFWKMLIMAVAAGSSERLVPSLLEKFSSQTVAEGQEQATAASE
jgi:hypothetical protein